jgi:PAS domain S-box-containing protein
MKKTINEITHPDDRPFQKGRLEKMMGGKDGSYRVEKRYICRNGLPLWVIETISVERDNAGSFLYGMVVVEVNDRKCAQGLFQLMLESSREAMAVLDERGNVVLVNSAVERIFGYQHSELFGKKIDLLLPDLPPTGTRSSFARLQVGLKQGRSDSHGLRKDGTFFPAKVEVQTIEMGRGGWNITSIADLSEYKQPEEEGVSHAFQHKFGAQWQAGRPFFAAAGSELSQLHSRPAP